MRAFIALPIPLKLAKTIHSDFSFLSSPKVRLIPPENMHITLNFLGEKREEDIKKIEEQMNEFSLKPFEVFLEGFSAFPSKNFIRVLYIGVRVSPSIEEELKKFSTSFEGEPFSSLHLTVARVKGKIKIDFSRKISYGSFFADRIVLYQSILKKPSVVYKELFSLPLRF